MRTFSPRLSHSHSGACCSYYSQNHNRAKQKLREAESRRVLPPKLHAGPESGSRAGLGWGTPAAGVESAPRSGTPLRDRTGSVIARLSQGLLSPPPAASQSHCSPGDGAGFSAPRLPPGRDGAHPRVRGGSPGRGPGRGGERGAARAGASAFPPSSLPLSPAPAAPALRTTVAASRHVGRQAPGL